MQQQQPVLVLQQNTERTQGRKAQIGNITAAKTVSDLIRTCLGPRAMLKMLLDPMGGIVMTNDGNAILRECEVVHPAAKSMIELSRTQDEEVGDGTTSVIILAGEILNVAQPFIEDDMHPTEIIDAFRMALKDGLEILQESSIVVNVDDRDQLLHVIKSTLGTKMIGRWSDLMCGLALDAVQCVSVEDGQKTIDIKRYARVEKIPGGEIEDCTVISGVMLNKDVLHSSMRRYIENPRIMLLDCPLEYTKGESSIAVNMEKRSDWKTMLEMEENYIRGMCDQIIALKPDLVITEKGMSDLAQQFFMDNNITALRRVRKSDQLRIAKACGATIVHQVEELKASDIGTGCGLYHVEKIGDEYWSFIEKCTEPKACTILLRGASKDILNEVERNLLDAMNVARNVVFDPKLCPGGGASEMAVAVALREKSKSIAGHLQYPYRAIAEAMEIIPRTLVQNCGASVIRLVTQLRARHAEAGNASFGIDGEKGVVVDMKTYGVWEPYVVKAQTFKTAIEAACLLLRVDDIVSGVKKGGESGGPGMQQG